MRKTFKVRAKVGTNQMKKNVGRLYQANRVAYTKA